MRADSDLVMICTSDIAGQLRGKAVPRHALAARQQIGVGWTPTNVLITAFGPIAPSPWGALGDLCLVPDPATAVDLELPEWGIDECFVLGDVRELDGTPWACCLRSQLATAARRLERDHGLRLLTSFEQEFHYFGAEAQPGLGYALRAHRRLGPFPNRLMAVLESAGLETDSFMPEYGPGQCEATIGPQAAPKAADQASILRELVRATARGLGARASFAPILDPGGVGNGTHVHFSLWDTEGRPVSYDSARPHGVSHVAGAFLAGVLRHLPEYLAMTASAVVSYLRLTPHRWSAAFDNLGRQDREAAVRICPIFGTAAEAPQRFNFEFRAADAAASPHLVLAAVLNAGLSGLEQGLPMPPVTQTDLAALSEADLARTGCRRLPTSLTEALALTAESAWAEAAFGATLVDAFVRHKRAEIEALRDLTDAERCARYAQAY